MAMSHMGHTIKKFDEELSTLRDLVLRMGGLVEAQLRRAVESLQTGDVEQAKDVVQGDREIDRIELRADEEIASLLALRAPLGVDLRTILTLSKTVNDLERIGDEAKKVARATRDLSDQLDDDLRGKLIPPVATLANHALKMLHDALDALVRLDLERAESVRESDDLVDKAFVRSIEHLSGAIRNESELVSVGVQLLFAAKGLERIGDHAKNIAMYVYYLVDGRDMRHPKVNPHRQTQG